MDEIEGLETFEDQVTALERSIGGAAAMASAFEGEMRAVRASFVETGREAAALSRGISRGLRQSIDGLVFDGEKLSDALRGVAQSMVNAAYSAAVKPVTDQFGGLIAAGIEGLVGRATGFAAGGSFAQGRVMPFANGGVVSGRVTFPMRGGTGLMGEAGPEAIMPLSRGADGRLGVRASGGGRPVNVVINVSTPDAAGFQRSQGQIAAQVSRAIARGQRNL